MLWWGRQVQRPGEEDVQPVAEFPDLLPDDSRAVRAAIAARISAFTLTGAPASPGRTPVLP